MTWEGRPRPWYCWAVKLFVYGSLRRGQPAHARLRGAKLVAFARTEPRFTLVDMGSYPALLEGGETAVCGEIYEIDPALLAELDRYEEAPELYVRRTALVEGHEVFVYLLPAEHARGLPRVPGGDWCNRAG